MIYPQLTANLSKNRPKVDRDGSPANAFASAAILARKRRYTEASRQLQLAVDYGHCTEPEALDLQARIYVQQGMHLLAESCWLKAQSLDGSNPGYEEALNRLRQAHLPFFRLSRIVVGSCVIAVVLLAGWQLTALGRLVQKNQHATSESIEEVRTDLLEVSDFAQQRHESLSHVLSALDDRSQGLQSAVTNRLELVPTAAALGESQAALTSRLEDRLVPLSEAVGKTARDLGGVARTQEAARAGSVANFERLENDLTQLSQTISQTTHTLAAQQQSSVAARRQVDEEMDRALAEIREEIARLASIIEETKASL